MSTKASIGYGDGFHLYYECFEDDRVYLELEKVDFEASRDRVTVAIPIEIWELVRQCKAADTSYAALSDEELEAMGKSLAQQERERPKQTGIKRALGILNPLTVGTGELEEEEVEAEIIRRLFQRRDKDRALLEKIEAFARDLQDDED